MPHLDGGIEKEIEQARKTKIMWEHNLQKARRKYGEEHEAVLGIRGEYSRSRTRYVNTMRCHKKKAWLDCVQISSEENPWGAVYKILMGKLKRSTQKVALRTDGG